MTTISTIRNLEKRISELEAKSTEGWERAAELGNEIVALKKALADRDRDVREYRLVINRYNGCRV